MSNEVYSIPLFGKGKCIVAFSVVDEEDYEWLMTYRFYRHKSGYALTTVRDKQRMHCMIMAHYYGPLGIAQVDHIDGDKLNNQKYNLRLTDAAGNARNKHHHPKSVALYIPYKGVTRKDKRYHVNVTVDRNQLYGGAFNEMRDAAIAYDILAKRLHGDFACLNFPDLEETERLRVQRMMDNPKKLKGISRYRGVTKNKGKWTARFTFCNTKTHLGYFETEEEAAVAYNKVALACLGDKARLNIIPS